MRKLNVHNRFAVWTAFAWLGIFLALASTAGAGPFTKDENGTTALAFLKVPMGPRSVGMGSAYTAVAEGPESLWWNPAGLIESGHTSIFLENSFLMDDLLLDTVALQVPIDQGNAFGLMVTRLAFNLPMPGYDNTGLETKPVDYSEMLFAAGYGTDVFDMPFGFVIKGISSKLADASSLAFAGDAGLRQNFLKKDLTMGLCFKNIGQKVQYVNTGYPLPFMINLGAAYYLFRRDLVIAGDVQAPFDQQPHYHLGVEFSRSVRLAFRFALRAGYNTNYVQNTDALNGLNTGLGVDWRINQRILARTGRMIGYKEQLLVLLGLDYAWLPNNELGASHRLSLRIEF
jgi:hypothetical protein